MSCLKNAAIVELNLIEKHKVTTQSKAASEHLDTSSLRIFENRVAFSVSEVAYMVGLSVRTVERTVQRGELAARRVGRRLLVPKKELEAWLYRKD